MKKILVLILALSFIFSLAACGKDDSGNSDSGKDTYSENGGKNDNKPSENEIDDNTWAAFYEAYKSGSEAAGSAMSDAINSIDNFQAVSLSMGMLNYSMGELNLALTTSFLSGNESSVRAAFVFLTQSGSDVDYKEKGDTATLKYKSADGNDTSYVLSYDKRSATAQLEYSDGKTTNITTLCVQDDYVAKTYYDSSSKNYLEAVAYTDGDAFFSWGDQADKLETNLYKNAKAAKSDSFGKNGKNYVSLVDGVIDGSALSSEGDSIAAWMS